MKTNIKRVIAAMIATLMCFCTLPDVFAAMPIVPEIWVNEKSVVFPDVKPVVVKGRTLVPVRGVFERLGCDVTWVEAERRVEIRRNARLIVLEIENPYIVIGTVYENGQAVQEREATLDVAPCVINGRTMIPVRAVADCLGASVEWLSAINTVNITDESISDGEEPPIYAPPSDTPFAEKEHIYLDMNAAYVRWHDRDFEKCVREILGKYLEPVSIYDCREIETLDLTGYDIQSLEDLRYFENLKYLYISDAYGINIEPVSQMDELKELQMCYCGIDDIWALSTLDDLYYLDLTGNEIEDLTPVENMQKLASLYLDNNNITDISGISDIMQQLESFSIYNNPLDMQELIYDDEDFYDIFGYIVYHRNEQNRTPVIFNDPCVNYIMRETENYFHLTEYTDYLKEVYMLEWDSDYYECYVLDAEDLHRYDFTMEWMIDNYPDIVEELIYAKYGRRTMYATMHYSDDGEDIILEIIWGY